VHTLFEPDAKLGGKRISIFQRCKAQTFHVIETPDDEVKCAPVLGL
jgi:hypothetical protein